MSVFIFTAKTKPATEQKPTTSVMAISMVVKLPDTMCAHPSKNSQMSPIRNSQKRKAWQRGPFAPNRAAHSKNCRWPDGRGLHDVTYHAVRHNTHDVQRHNKQ
jgi:hypothetical protein